MIKRNFWQSLKENSVGKVQSHLNLSKRSLGSSGCSITPVVTQTTGGGDFFFGVNN